MRLASLVSLTLTIALGVGCGARTGEDELLTQNVTAVGGAATGGTGGSGGTGGFVSTGGSGPGPCCQVSGGRGCPDENIESCVCASDSFCCEGAWDEECVEQVVTRGCGVCAVGSGGVGGTGGTGGVPGTGGMPSTGGVPGSGGSVGNCCSIHGEPGCNNYEIQYCVCQNDPFCCETAWDGICLDGLDECQVDCPAGSGGGGTGGFGGAGGGPNVGGTGGIPNTGGTGGIPNTGGFPGTGGFFGTGGMGGGSTVDGQTCCQEHGDPLCSQKDVEDCVCQFDSYCCTNSWDWICVDEAAAQCGASCDSPECAYIYSPSCESCVCDSCHDSSMACLADAGCACVLETGCSLLGCISACGPAITATSLTLLNQLSTCEQISGCGCQ